MKIAPKALKYYNTAAASKAIGKRGETLNLKARVKTSEFGFNAGPLGISFTSRRVEFEPDDAAKSSETLHSKLYRHAQNEESDINSIREEMSTESAYRKIELSTEKSSYPAYMRNRAISTYQSFAEADYYIPGRALGSV